MKVKERAAVVSQTKLTEDICDLRLKVSFAGECRPGQFVSVMREDKSCLMPRPISICEAGDGMIRLVYRIVGGGTEEFSCLGAGDSVTVIGPLGNTFPMEACAGRRVLLVGGGIGIPPMYNAGKCLVSREGDAAPAGVAFAAGYRSETYLDKDMAAAAPLYIATEDGSCGTKGNVLDAIRQQGVVCDVMFACGPKPMLRALKTYADEQGIDLWVSLEEKMACGIGACLGCVGQSTDIDSHSHVRNKRICKDGPVFNSRDVVL